MTSFNCEIFSIFSETAIMSHLPERTKPVEVNANPSFVSNDPADVAGQLQIMRPLDRFS